MGYVKPSPDQKTRNMVLRENNLHTTAFSTLSMSNSDAGWQVHMFLAFILFVFQHSLALLIVWVLMGKKYLLGESSIG